jgi:hypothetical protein
MGAPEDYAGSLAGLVKQQHDPFMFDSPPQCCEIVRRWRPPPGFEFINRIQGDIGSPR